MRNNFILNQTSSPVNKRIKRLALLFVLTCFSAFQLKAGICTLNIPGCTATPPTCHGSCDGSITVNHSGGTGPYTYLWSNGQTAKTAVGLCAGSYTVTVYDAAGCSKTKTKAISRSRVSGVTTYQHVSCYGACDGSITVQGQGGVAPYTYLWSNGNTTNTISGICANIYYTITITDANQCTFVCKRKVTQPSNLNATTTGDAVTCLSGCDGVVSVTPTGGTPPYTYLWSNGDQTASSSGLCEGTYTVTVTDAHNCTKVKTATVTGNTTGNVSVSCAVVSDESAPGANDGELSSSPSGGTPPYSFLWSNTQTTQNATGLTAGTYTVTATDANGCAGSTSCAIITLQQDDCDNDFTTYTQGGWANPGAPGQYMAANFESCFGTVVIGDPCGYTITLTTVPSVQDFLPQGTGPAALTQNYTDPGSGNITVLAGQVLSVQFALGFDECDPNLSASSTDLGDQIYVDNNSVFYGWSIQAIYDTARKVLSGCPSLYSPSAVNEACTDINENYDEGNNNNLFVCPEDFNNARLSQNDAIGISVAPNPFETSIKLNIDGDEPLNIKVIDATGRIFLQMSGINQTTVLQTDWSDGIYFIIAENENASYRKVLKVIRTH